MKNANKRGNHQKAQVRFEMVAISFSPKSVRFPDEIKNTRVK